MYQFLNSAFEKIILRESSLHRLTASACVGIFFACSPLLGVQIIVASTVSWAFGLNTALMLIMLCIVNNPFTMIPIIFIDYFVGYILLEKILHISLHSYEPVVFARFNKFLADCCSRYIAFSSFSIWNYFIGGVIFALICSIVSYPLLYALFKYIKERRRKTRS